MVNFKRAFRWTVFVVTKESKDPNNRVFLGLYCLVEMFILLYPTCASVTTEGTRFPFSLRLQFYTWPRGDKQAFVFACLHFVAKYDTKGLFALREILFVLQKNLSTRNHFKCERFFSSTKILSSVTKLQRDRRVALEAYNFLSSEKIYCSVTATLQRVIIFRNRYHTKWYCVRDPIYRC